MGTARLISILSIVPQRISGHVNALRDQGYEVEVFSTIADLKRNIEETYPDLVLLDSRSQNQNIPKIIQETFEYFHPDLMPFAILSSTAMTSIQSKYKQILVTTPIPQFLQSIRHILKNRSEVEVPVAPTRVTARVPTVITSVNEGGILIEAPTKIKSNSLVEIESEKLDQLGLGKCIFKRTQLPSRLSENDQFFNDMVVTGISPETADRIKKMKQGRNR